MTDKIIIDGVDVSGCEFVLNSIWVICNLKNGKTDKCNCSNYPNCYYKQLKRKEGECERLNKDEERIYQCNKNIKKENAKLYNELQAEKEKVKDFEKKLHFQDVTEFRKEEEKGARIHFENLAEKYKRALEEIKGMARTKRAKDCKICIKRQCSGNNCYENGVLEILQKCEVLDD